MARIDFYLLKPAGEQARRQFACRLTEKAYRLDNSVHIHTASRADAERLNELLWTFRDGSFVPHHLLDGAQDAPAPVTIGYEERHNDAADLLINLSASVPDFAGAFPRIAELVSSDEDCKLQSRKRFAQYRAEGHTLETHTL